jgi:ferritin-like metal-binding protein YciE
MEWLRDAHAAEEQAETMLSGMARRIENYPELKARIEQHIGETQRQADAFANASSGEDRIHPQSRMQAARCSGLARQ